MAIQKWYYDKRVQNDLNGANWAPHQYKEHLESLMANKGNMIKFVVLFSEEVERKQPPRDNSRNPNHARRGPPKDKEDDEVKRVKWQMAKRFRDACRSATNEDPDDDEDAIRLKNSSSSSSESEIPEKKLPETKSPGKPASKAAPKPMPKQPKEKKAPESIWRKKKPEVDSDSSEPAQASSSRAPAKKAPVAKVNKLEPHSDTS